jgi:hypothetical protein
VKKRGFNEIGEPVLEEIDDFKGIESEEKRKAIRWVIISGLILGVIFALGRWYFWDMGEKDLSQGRFIKRY